MSRFMRNTIFGLAVGAAGAVGGAAAGDAMYAPVAEQLQSIEDCAAQLGATSVQTQVYPDACPRDHFPYTYEVSIGYNSDGTTNRHESPHVYALPAASEYRQAERGKVVTEEDERRVEIGFTALGFALGATIGLIVSDIIGLQRKSRQETASRREQSAV